MFAYSEWKCTFHVSPWHKEWNQWLVGAMIGTWHNNTNDIPLCCNGCFFCAWKSKETKMECLLDCLLMFVHPEWNYLFHVVFVDVVRMKAGSIIWNWYNEYKRILVLPFHKVQR